MHRSSNGTVILAALGIVLIALTAMPRVAAASVNPGDVIYLSDSGQANDGTSQLFSVQIDAITGHANLTALPNGLIYLNQIDALACTPDGSKVYGIDKYEPGATYTGDGMMGYYDVANETWHDVNYVTNVNDGSKVLGIVLAGFSPAGVLYVASQNTDLVYTVDLNSAEATPIGPVVNSDTGVTVHETGADLAFTADGIGYIWTNTSNGAGALSGLYKLDMQAATDHIPATRVGSVPGDFFTGIAIRANGFGDLTGSTHTNSQIHTQSLTDAQDTAGSPHPMYLNGAPYLYEYGDMSNGPLELCTRTIGYYKNHDWMGRGVTICGVGITQDGINGTENGQDFLNGSGAFSSKPTSTDFSMLFAQLIAAKLNTGNASGVAVIDPAEAWLCQQNVILPSGGLDFHAPFTSRAQKNTATSYSSQLDTFNNSYEDNCSVPGSNNNSGSLDFRSGGRSGGSSLSIN